MTFVMRSTSVAWPGWSEWRRIGPVSYTHLDVYKRQSPGHPLTPRAAATVEAVRSGQLSPEQLDALCNQMLSILEPNASTTSTLYANR